MRRTAACRGSSQARATVMRLRPSRLMWLCRGATIALKVDVEGYEAQVLSGAEQLLSRNGGFAQIEAREDAAAAVVAERMVGFGWRFLERYGLDLRFEKP